MVIIEGIDASGKSTLGKILARRLGYTLIESEGPPRYTGEINDRIKRYLSIPNALFVRHPAISQPIYERLRGDEAMTDPYLIREVYDQCKLFVYCDPLERGLEGHVVKDGENPDHLAKVQSKYHVLLGMYRNWAIQHAQVFYRIGDPIGRIVDICSTIK